jgi:hypothetical protein
MNKPNAGLVIALDMITKVPLYATLLLTIFLSFSFGIYQFSNKVLKPISAEIKAKKKNDKATERLDISP